ncbi:ATP-binding cassette domain-containing protein [Billgrantia aerodenitrificans]|uniref:ATP-binding cassette domain-containing protein n=1 Tax=Billgrantia aerodenitrificans TaxID=2733483 RepID=UPI0030B80ED5
MPASAELESLTLKGVRHCYYHEQSDEVFELGSIDMTFGPGEIVFLVGGNGSGKATLAKLHFAAQGAGRERRLHDPGAVTRAT